MSHSLLFHAHTLRNIKVVYVLQKNIKLFQVRLEIGIYAIYTPCSTRAHTYNGISLVFIAIVAKPTITIPSKLSPYGIIIEFYFI